MDNAMDTLALFEGEYDNDEVVFGDETLDRLYTQISGLDDRLVVTYNETCQLLNSEELLESRIERDKTRELHMIISVVGDDEYTTTDSIALGPALIGFGPVINGIKLSLKDSGISPYVGNYAEGWVINPPNVEATFEATNRRHGRSGVPFTLDPVKLKLLSPVRKQSPTWELDLESKLEHLAEIAGWTDRRWFTYDYHQLCLLVANVIFDFEDATTFPFLFKTEGGCGGSPPYGNLDTMYSALHYYTRGKSRSGVLGVMEEAVGINTGLIAPKDTFFLRNSRLANLGDAAWLKYESAYRSVLQQGALSRSEANDLLRSQEAEGLPDNILSMGVEVESHSFAVGASLSALRKEGLIMSEMDVKTALDNQVRNSALLGEMPIGLLNQKIKAEAEVFRGKHLKVLSQLSEVDPSIREGLKARGMLMPTLPDRQFRKLATSYYSMRTEEYSRYSSLHYTDAIRVFKTADIRDYLEGQSRAVRADFARTDSLPRWRESFLEENLEERNRRKIVHDWFHEKPLGEILYNPLPPGVGTDDSRIARSVLDIVDKTAHIGAEMFILLLFSGDRQLARYTFHSLRNVVSGALRVFTIDRSMYTRICLDGAQEFATAKLRGLVKDPKRPWSHVRTGPVITYYNYVMKSKWVLPMSIMRQLSNSGGVKLSLEQAKAIVHVEYDYPNMERGLDCIRMDPRTGTIEEYGGGYLEGRTLQSFAEHECWAKQELAAIYSWSDFDIVRSKRHYPLNGGSLRTDRSFASDPVQPSTYGKVEAWRRSTRRYDQRSWSNNSADLDGPLQGTP